jgi:hypothetical protein
MHHMDERGYCYQIGSPIAYSVAHVTRTFKRKYKLMSIDKKLI